jgi:hypothetical protein
MPDSTELARIRFGIGNEQVKVRVNRQPTFDVTFQSENWTLYVRHIERWVLATRGCLIRLAPLFPREPPLDIPPPFIRRRRA